MDADGDALAVRKVEPDRADALTAERIDLVEELLRADALVLAGMEVLARRAIEIERVARDVRVVQLKVVVVERAEAEPARAPSDITVIEDDRAIVEVRVLAFDPSLRRAEAGRED